MLGSIVLIGKAKSIAAVFINRKSRKKRTSASSMFIKNQKSSALNVFEKTKTKKLKLPPKRELFVPKCQ